MRHSALPVAAHRGLQRPASCGTWPAPRPQAWY